MITYCIYIITLYIIRYIFSKTTHATSQSVLDIYFWSAHLFFPLLKQVWVCFTMACATFTKYIQIYWISKPSYEKKIAAYMLIFSNLHYKFLYSNYRDLQSYKPTATGACSVYCKKKQVHLFCLNRWVNIWIVVHTLQSGEDENVSECRHP